MLKPDRFSCSQKIRLKRDPPVLPVLILNNLMLLSEKMLCKLAKIESLFVRTFSAMRLTRSAATINILPQTSRSLYFAKDE